MFHIGIATQHPPLPEPGQLSEGGINFIKQCLTIDPMMRPTALELMSHPWMLEFRETLAKYEEMEMMAGKAATTDLAASDEFKNATAARTVARDHQEEVEAIKSTSPMTFPSDLPSSLSSSPSP
jgi:mitogen-activated protein kinase kinase kinase